VSALDRLADLADEYGITVEAALTALLDGDPHDHQHRCPTCARLAAKRDRAAHDADQMRLRLV